MKRTFTLLSLCLFVMLLTTPAMAEFFKYRDSNGVLRFTDNLAEVPPDQRPKATSYKEPDDYLTPQQKRDRAEKASREAEAAAKKEKEDSFEVGQKQRMDLNKTRLELDKEYGELVREKKALQKEKEKALSPEQQTEYKKRVNALNKRIIDYEARRNRYEEGIKEFNAKAKAQE